MSRKALPCLLEIKPKLREKQLVSSGLGNNRKVSLGTCVHNCNHSHGLVVVRVCRVGSTGACV